jgi:hypothetical protein
MTDKIANFDAVPILVGQRWVTRYGQTVRILATDGLGNFPVIGEVIDEMTGGGLGRWKLTGKASSEGPDGGDLINLAPQTVKREVALYQSPGERNGFVCEYYPQFEPPVEGDDRRISEPLTIEFTLLPGESA